jgi:hypothetical protein
MRKGILTNGDGDLMIAVRRDSEGMILGGLVVGNSDEQHIEHNLICNKGEIKGHPYIGCEIVKEDKGILGERFLKKVQQSLELDGYSMGNVNFLINR